MDIARCAIRHRGSAFSEKISDKPAALLAAIRQGREVGTEHVAQETERLYDKKQEHEAEVQRDWGPGHEL
jgi:hypothetical protein